MNAIKLFFLFGFFLLFSGVTSAQRAIVSATLSLNSITHATCYGDLGTANVQLSVYSNIPPYVVGGYTFVINKDGAYFSTISSSTLQGSASIAVPITGLPVGYYTISGTATVSNPTTGPYGSPGFTNLSFFVGYQALWTETKEMAIQTVTSTVLQNVTTPTSTYAGARASNTDPGDLWFLATPTFNSGNATNRSVYVSLINTANLVSFNPSSQNNYLEFRKAGSDPNTGDGVYYKSSSGTYKLTGVTYTDKIRVLKFGNSLLFYKDQGSTALASGATNPYIATLAAQVNLTAFTTVINDGVNIATTLKCNSSNDVYATLFNELDGYYYTVKNGKLRFTFNQNYDTQSNLKFTIYSRRGYQIRTQSNFPAVLATYGENYVTLDLTTSQNCIGQDFFILEVISDKMEKTYLRFYNEYSACTQTPEQPGDGQ